MRYLPAGSPISAGLVAVLLISSDSSVLTRQAPAAAIATPAQGVGFVGQFVQTQPNGSRWAGDYYRRHDYSFAMYGTHSVPGRSSTRMVTITNAETMHHYLFREAVGYWVRVPLSSGPPVEGLRYRLETPETNGLVPEMEPFGGLTVYREQQADGSLRLLAPELNFFPVLVQFRSGMRQEVTGITLTQPEAHLFLPPADAKVVDGPAPAVHQPR